MGLRGRLNRVYSTVRGVDSSLDESVSGWSIASFLAEKAFQKARSLARGNASGFRGRSVRIHDGRLLHLGRGVTFGSNVTINAMSRSGIVLGDFVTVDDFTILRASGVIRNMGEGIHVGSGTAIGAFNFLHGGGGVRIGKDCLLGPYVSIYSENHITSQIDVPIRHQGESRQPVRIGDDVWVGAGSTVLAGVTIGSGSVVASGAVVTRNVAPRTIVGGVPARVIGQR